MPDHHHQHDMTDIELALDAPFIRVLIAAHRAGAGIRSMARCFGMSKSTVARLLEQIKQLEKLQLVLSQLGQADANSPAGSIDDQSDLSQMGHNKGPPLER